MVLGYGADDDARSGATVLALDDLTAEADDATAHSLAHGVLRLEGRATIGDEMVAEAKLTMVVRDTPDGMAGSDPRSAS